MVCMPKFNYIQNSFNYGQISSKLFGRTDLEEYIKGAKRVENVMIQSHGGAQRRPGTVFVDDLSLAVSPVTMNFKDSTGAYLLIKTRASDATDNKTWRIYRADEKESPELVFTTTGSCIYYTNSTIYYEGTNIYDGDYYYTCTTTHTSPGTGYIEDDTTNWSKKYIDPSGWTTAQISQFLVCTHNSGLIEPFIITHDEGGIVNAWRIFPWSSDIFGIEGTLESGWATCPYKFQNTNHQIQLNLSILGNVITSLTDFFDDSSIGRTYIIDAGTIQVPATVISVGAPTVANVSISVDTTGGVFETYTSLWAEGSWGADTYPRTVTYYNNRLIFGGTVKQPDTIWLSSRFNFRRFAQTILVQDETDDVSGSAYYGEVLPEHPFDLTLGYDTVDDIQWMVGGTELFIGTDLAEFIIPGRQEWDKLTVDTDPPVVEQYTKIGSSNTNAIIADSLAIFIDKTGIQLSSLLYSDNNAAYIHQSLSNLSPDLLLYTEAAVNPRLQGIKKLLWDNTRRTLWVLDRLNKLAALTLDTTSRTIAWQRVITDGEVTNINVIYNNMNRPVPLMVVNRDGEYLLERLPEDFTCNDLSLFEERDEYQNYDVITPYFADSSVYMYSELGQTTWNIPHLANKTVKYLLDGIASDGTIDASGDLTTITGSILVVGVAYTSVLETNPINTQGYFGGSIGSIQRIHEAVVNLYNTWSIKIGKVRNSQDKIYPAKITSDFTGSHDIKLNDGFSRGETLVMTSDDPLPFGVASVVLKGTVNE